MRSADHDEGRGSAAERRKDTHARKQGCRSTKSAGWGATHTLAMSKRRQHDRRQRGLRLRRPTESEDPGTEAHP